MNKIYSEVPPSQKVVDGVVVIEKRGAGITIEFKQYPDQVCILSAYPDERILFVLSNLGSSEHNIGDEWAARLKNVRQYGKSPYDIDEMFRVAEAADIEIVEWLIDEVKKLSSDQLTPSLQAKILSMLSGED